jgi:hypothetical protein
MMGKEEIFEMLVFNSTLTRLIAQEGFSTFIHQESLIYSSYFILPHCISVKNLLFNTKFFVYAIRQA